MILDRINAEQVTISECRYGRMMYLLNDRYIGAAFQDYGEYSESEVELWRGLLAQNPKAVVADIGANLGAHTVALARIVPQGVVFAFEPLPFVYHLLCGNVALNGLGNVVTYRAAIGAETGEITVPAIDYTQEGNYGGVSLTGIPHGNRAPLLRLDDVMPRVDLLKADVEGMERAVLEGAHRLLSTYRPILYLENNPPLESQERLIGYVQSLGYDVWWHCAPLYNPNNYKANQTNVYDNVVSFNILCLPSHADTRRMMGVDPVARVG